MSGLVALTVALLDDESPSPGPGCGWPRECGGEQTQASASNGRSKGRKIYLNERVRRPPVFPVFRKGAFFEIARR
ncbi:hypothetical protein M2281_000251 [Mesorhizobium soli]|nr:hypothetical protein [Mesorhizobium soli]